MKTYLELPEPTYELGTKQNWVHYEFETERDAKQALSYVKSLLPHLSEVTLEDKVGFRLTEERQRELVRTSVDPADKPRDVGAQSGEVGAQSGEVGAQSGEVGAQSGEVGAQSGDVVLHPRSRDETSTSRGLSAGSIDLTPLLDPTADLDKLRAKIRKNAPTLTPKGDFYIKTLRGDTHNYFHQFVEELLDPTIRYPKRKGPKGR